MVLLIDPEVGRNGRCGRRWVGVGVEPCFEVGAADPDVTADSNADGHFSVVSPRVDRLERHAEVFGNFAEGEQRIRHCRSLCLVDTCRCL